MNIHEKYILLSDFINCDKCCHKDICVVKKDMAGEKIGIPMQYDDDCPFDIHINCKYFQEQLIHVKKFDTNESRKKAVDSILDALLLGNENKEE